MEKPAFTAERKLFAALCILLFLTMLLFNFLTPMLADDFTYCFSFSDDSPMESLSQIIPSMAAHRSSTNGRVIAHAMVQFFLLFPKFIFNIVNTLNILLLVRLFGRFMIQGSRRRLLLLCCGIFLFWNYTPAFGQIFLWLDGSVNYSWGISIFLLFILPYVHQYLKDGISLSPLMKLLFVILGFAAGAYSENGSVALIFAIICLSLLILIRDRRLPLHLSLALAAALAGFVFLMTAPATSGRSSAMDFSTIMYNVRIIASGAREVLLPIYIIFALSFVAALSVRAPRERLILSALLFISGAGSLAAFIFAAYFSERHYCFTVFFTVLACLINLDAAAEGGKGSLLKYISAAAAVLFAFNFVLGSIDIAVSFKKSLVREGLIREALQQGSSTVSLEIYDPLTPYSAAFNLPDINPAGSDEEWPNMSVAAYYGLDRVTGIPPEK